MSRSRVNAIETGRLSVLLLEDSAADAELVSARLEDAGFDLDIHRVWTRDAFMAALGDRDFDAILADHVLPQFDGDTALELASRLAPDVPFIFVSGTLTEELAVEALKRGATDYVVKQRLQRLPDALHRALVEARERRERQAAETALRESRERLQLITDSLPVLIAYVDRAQRYRFNNKAYETWFGRSAEELYGERLADVVGADAYAQLRPQIERALAGERFSFESEIAFASGSRHIQVDYIPDRHEDGTIGGYYALIQDIGDRKRAEEQQRLTSARFLEAIDGTGSSMGALIRSKDWSETPLGPPSGWSTALRSSLGIGLNSVFPVCVYWGPELLLLYNDPWSPIPGDKHPWALGRPAREAWSDIWDIIGPMFQGVMDSGIGYNIVDGLLPMQRHGYVEECYFNYNVSPIYGEDGRVAGLFNSVIETSYRVIGERRADLLRRLADRSGGVRTAEEACTSAAEVIATDPADLPFCLLYLIERDDESARAVLAAATGLELGSIAAPAHIDLRDGTGFWPLADAADGFEAITIEDFAERIGDPLVLEPWPEPIRTAHVLPMPDATRPAELFGFLVAGISPRVALDETYRTFLTNVSAHVANGIANARIAESDRQAAEELQRRVAETAAERDRIWQVSQDLLLIADAEGRYQRLNPAWQHQLGYGDNELVGIGFDALVHPEDVEAVHHAFASLATSGAMDSVDVRIRTKEGDYRCYSWTAVAVGDGFYASGRDVTARRELEEQLRQAQKMEAVGQLTGGIAHDFNNLLTVVSGNVDMAMRSLTAQGALDARTQRGLDNALKGANRAAALTQRLLAFSRRQPLAPKALDIDKLVQGMSDLLNRSLGELVRLEVVTAPGLWRAEVDPNQLESAILNLAVNARDAMAEGGTLTIETANAYLDEGYASQQAEVAPGHYVVIAVSDTGAGMSKETVAHVFEPFFTTKEVGKGTGLGLSMVYGFTKQSGGHVKIYSELGEGTTVKLYLPRLMAEPEVEHHPPSPASLETGEHDELILVVEDDDDVRAYTVDCLRELGYRVLEAHDGPSALRLLDREGPSVALLFTDVVMPGMSGRDLAEQAREKEPALKVLFTSGYARNAIGSSGRIEAGVQIIAKPFTFAALAAKVRDVLDRGDTGRILVVERARARRAETVRFLDTAGYVVEEAADATEALGKIRSAQGRYDGVVLHQRKGPVEHGLVAELRALHVDLPVLVLADTDAAELGERYGADRCLQVLDPPFTELRIVGALRRLDARCIGGED